MEDSEILKLYFDRSPEAIEKTQEKYGRYCSSVALNVLGNTEDAEECVNDMLLRVWNAIPPAKPDSLKAYAGRITRNVALDRYDSRTTGKRGGGTVPLVLDELSECVGKEGGISSGMEAEELAAAVNRFLKDQPADKRKVFVRRYWYQDPLSDICERYGLKESHVKTILFRMRQNLKKQLKEEGLI